MTVTEVQPGLERQLANLPDLEAEEFELVNENDFGDNNLAAEIEIELQKILEIVNPEESQDVVDAREKELAQVITKIGDNYEHWVELRKETIKGLRETAEYIDKVTHKSTLAKAVGSGSGIVAGTLTLAGGVMTILSAGAALPVLLAGTSLGLAAGVTGGTAAVTEKIIKSKQMKLAKLALEADYKATMTMEASIAILKKNSKIMKQVARQAILSGGGAVSSSLKIVNLVAGKAGGTVGTLEAGIKATAQLLGEDIGKAVSKMLLHTSGRVFTGAVTVVFSGATMIYDIYKLNGEIQTLAGKGEDGANELRSIANELEASLEDFLNKDLPSIDSETGLDAESSLKADNEV